MTVSPEKFVNIVEDGPSPAAFFTGRAARVRTPVAKPLFSLLPSEAANYRSVEEAFAVAEEWGMEDRVVILETTIE